MSPMSFEARLSVFTPTKTMFWSQNRPTEIPAFVVLPVKRCTAVPIPPGPNAVCRSMVIFGLGTIANSSDCIRGVCVGSHVTSGRGDSTQVTGVDPVAGRWPPSPRGLHFSELLLQLANHDLKIFICTWYGVFSCFRYFDVNPVHRAGVVACLRGHRHGWGARA
ncbi:hypothetical protein MRX96_050677 [Rhipicephalus microplus]